MPDSIDPYQKWRSLLGGLLFGGYFAGGLAYFETFSPSAFSLPSLYLPVFVVLGLIGGGLTWIAFSSKVDGLPLIKSIAGLSATFLLICGILIIWGMIVRSAPEEAVAQSLLAATIFENMALLSILPAAGGLILFHGNQVPAAKPMVASTQPPASATGTDSSKSMLSLNIGQGNAAFEVANEAVIYVEAADNYCKIHHLEAGGPKMEMVRTRIKDIEKALGTTPHFFRVHRSYLVNGHQVEAVAGTSQALKLIMKHETGTVPVSRSFDVSPLQNLLEEKPI